MLQPPICIPSSFTRKESALTLSLSRAAARIPCIIVSTVVSLSRLTTLSHLPSSRV